MNEEENVPDQGPWEARTTPLGASEGVSPFSLPSAPEPAPSVLGDTSPAISSPDVPAASVSTSADPVEPEHPIAGVVHRLDPAHVPASRLAALITTCVFTVGGIVGGSVFWFSADDLAVHWKALIVGAIALFVLFIAVIGFLWPRLELKRTRWRVGPEGIEIKRGVVWRHVVNVPSSRIQHTDVAQGPIQRRFGLATLVVHTAGTHEYEINLEGIAHGVAFEIRDYLLEARDGDGA